MMLVADNGTAPSSYDASAIKMTIGSNKKQGTSFPMKLYTLLQDAERLGFDDVVCWQPGGKSFKILQPKRFEREVMKLYFQKTKYKSFQRQLNIYNFLKFHHGPLRGGYQHPSFFRSENPVFDQLSRKPRQRHVVPKNQLLSSIEPIGALEGTAALSMLDDFAPELQFPVGFDNGTGGFPYGDDFDDCSAIEMNEVLCDFLLNYDDDLTKNFEENNFAPTAVPSSTSPTNTEAAAATATATAAESSGDESQPSSTDRFFPAKLYIMLEDSEKENFDDIVSWVNGGTAFKVHKSKEFVEKVMPNYFDQTKFESFRRQLNMYGYTRVNKGTNRGVTSHPSFIRGKRALCQSITRVAKNNNAITALR